MTNLRYKKRTNSNKFESENSQNSDISDTSDDEIESEPILKTTCFKHDGIVNKISVKIFK